MTKDAEQRLLLTDGKDYLANELIKLKHQIEGLYQHLHELEESYKDKRRRYHAIDRAQAMVDGRFKVIKGGSLTNTKPKQSTLANKISRLPKDKLAELIRLMEKQL